MSDAPRLAALEGTALSPWSVGQIEAELLHKSSIALIVTEEKDRRLIGWCCARVLAPESELLKITVLAGERRRGIGRLLLAELQRRCRSRGCRSLFLEVRAGNEGARSFYQQAGFHPTGRRRKYYRQPTDDAILMQKSLDNGRGGKMTMKTVRDLDLSGRNVLMRVDFNVPMDDEGTITDDIRIRSALPTIRHIRDQGGRLILCSHLGRPKGERVERYSLGPVARHLGSLLEIDVRLAPDCVGEEVEKMAGGLADGDVVLLENLRFHAGETENDPDFAERLAALAEVYVNDAFAVSHRAHASVVGAAERIAEKGAGLQLEKEMDYFHKAMNDPIRPLAALVGGAKVSSKLGALENMLDKVDRMVIGGAMANTFLKSMEIDMGGSKTEDDLLEDAKRFVARAKEKGVKLFFPVDFVVADAFAAEAVTKVVTFRDIPADWLALDIGPATTRLFQEALEDAGTIIWNGPMGAFEMDAFARGTMALCHSVAASQALSITGGGDSNAAVKKAGEEKNISYMSTGGGAFLMLMEGKTLPGVEVLER